MGLMSDSTLATRKQSELSNLEVSTASSTPSALDQHENNTISRACMHGLLNPGKIQRAIRKQSRHHRPPYTLSSSQLKLLKQTAVALSNHIIVHYRPPKRLIADQGANFESKIIREWCIITGIEKSRAKSHHPMGKGLTDRFIRTLLYMLGPLEVWQKHDSKSHITALVHAYNCTRQSNTGFAK